MSDAEAFGAWRRRLHTVETLHPQTMNRLVACLFTRHPAVAEEVLSVVERRMLDEIAREEQGR